MPSFGGIQAGKAFIKLTINDSEFQRGLTGSIRKLDNFGRSLISIGSRFALASAAFTTPFVAAIKAFADKGGVAADGLRVSLGSLKDSSSKVAQSIGQALTPSVIDFANRLANVTPSITKWISDNQTLVSLLPKVTVAVFGLATAIVAVGVALRGVALAAGAVALVKTHPLLAIAAALAAGVGGAAAAGLANNPAFAGAGGVAPTAGPARGLSALQRADIESGFELGSRLSTGQLKAGRRPAARGQAEASALGIGSNFLLKVFGAEQIGKGLPGFSSQRLDRGGLEAFTRSTFNGRTAGQILGGSNGIGGKLDKANAHLQQVRDNTQKMLQKLDIGPAHKFGTA